MECLVLKDETLSVGGGVLLKGRVPSAQAIFQCLQGLPEGGLRRIILTASGGAFRDWPVEKLKEVTAADAVKHPNWRCSLFSCIVPYLCTSLSLIQQEQSRYGDVYGGTAKPWWTDRKSSESVCVLS